MQQSYKSLVRWFFLGIGTCFTIIFWVNSQFLLAIVVAMSTVAWMMLGIIHVEDSKQIEAPQRYAKLANHLAASRWKEADEETTALLMVLDVEKEAGLYEALFDLPTEVSVISDFMDIPARRIAEYCHSIPCQDLQIIEELWSQYSSGRFGLYAQHKVVKENYRDDITMNEIGDLMGWRENNYWIYPGDFTFDIKAPIGHLPSGWIFFADQNSGSGILPQRQESGKLDNPFVVYAPVVWFSVQSRIAKCYAGGG